MNIKQLLSKKVSAAMLAAGLPEDTNPAISLSNRANFGDYQANGVMGAAKKLKTPRKRSLMPLALLELSEKPSIKSDLTTPNYERENQCNTVINSPNVLKSPRKYNATQVE